ncbi:glycosyl transferase [Rivularia sp. PCC 7116]|uniref:glycosyltransferase family 2 protein n=1 Tax=Rivularia sp. PCC 7116 TaxID=373994 RepID=UPI00029ECF3E|nr:glycosyltransferase family 2 protein [Rivularia sp. PCC 7116]AFY56182.1 glycosyl transferase [Rivularia sp. PCC 7116]
MNNILLSIIIPTYNRPHFLPRAVSSALQQTMEDIEVIVVDDGSDEPVNLPEHSRLRVIALGKNSGNAVARNVGLKAATGQYVTYLDDDDQLLPNMAQVSLDALKNSELPPPVAALSGLEVIKSNGEIVDRRIPPTLPRGSHFFLEDIEPEKSFLSKQTLVVERELLLELGGYDETFTSRVHTEMFLRLNPVCSILGLPTVTYQLTAHQGERISRDPALRQVNFERLLNKHESLFRLHPKTFATFLCDHAEKSVELGQPKAATLNLLRALKLDFKPTLRRIKSLSTYMLRTYTKQVFKEAFNNN